MKTLLKKKIENTVAKLSEDRKCGFMKLNREELLSVLKHEKCKRVQVVVKLRNYEKSDEKVGGSYPCIKWKTTYKLVAPYSTYMELSKEDVINTFLYDDDDDHIAYEVMIFRQWNTNVMGEFRIVLLTS